MSAKSRLVVIGNGMAGARLVEELLARGGGARYDITVFGDERHGNYNRILLSSVLAGGHSVDDIFINPLAWYEAHGVRLRAGVRVEAIDVAARQVTSADGSVEPYDALVIATGSRPLIPSIEGMMTDTGPKPGVFVFRTLDDCAQILEYAASARSAAIIGGGLLGLEAARGLLARGLDVHVVHLMPHLMDAQLDQVAGNVLRKQLEQMGVHVHVGTTTTAVLGGPRVSGLAFKDGTIKCDMVVVAAGIRANVELAAAAGLRVERGIVVGDDLASVSAPDVYAIGECAQHRGRMYGLVAPLWDQAAVLADRLSARNPHALYQESRLTTKLKVAGIDLAVMGDKEPIDEDDEVVSFADASRGVYKKLIVRNQRLVGAIVVGDGLVVPSLLRAYLDSTEMSDDRAELMFRAPEAARLPQATDIPDTAQICDCNAVSKAQIIQAVLDGARSVGAVSDATRACTGCGSCRVEVQRIVELACEGMTTPAVLDAPPRLEEPAPAAPSGGSLVVTLNKVERFKSEKDGLDVMADLPRFARDGWESIGEDDKERLKWLGIFFRRQTPGQFMMRVRMSNGMTDAAQFRVLAGITEEFGVGFADLTTRQQIQLRGFRIEHVPEIWRRLEEVQLVSLQTGQDNIRNVIGCPAAGLTGQELFDASPIAREFTDMFLRNKAYTNLPRKFNVAITACLESCTHAEAQDIALTPAVCSIDGTKVNGFNVAVGGKMGSGGFRVATPLDVFVRPEHAAALCGHIALTFRDYGLRSARSKARLAFLVEAWGPKKLRAEVERRGGRLLSAGTDARSAKHVDHLGFNRQKQPGLSYVGLTVPTGRITAHQLFEVARLADTYGNGEVRVTTDQNVIIPNVPDARIASFRTERVLDDLSPEASPALRGLVSCTGIDYCHLALIETKELALRTARQLEQQMPAGQRLKMHWSGCPAGCGNHAAADIGLLGKNVRVGGEIVEAVDVFVGGTSGPNAKPGTKLLENVPCDELSLVLERIIPFVTGRAATPRPARAQPDAAIT